MKAPQKKEAPYKVLVRDIPATGATIQKTLQVPAERVSEWLKGLPMRDALGAPEGDPDAGHGVAELELYAEGAHIFANGSFEGELTVACSRCVNPMKIVLDEQLHVTFMPKHELPDDEADDAAGEDGAEVAQEDLDLFPYDGEVVDLEPLLREQFVLAIPFAPLCSETCKGLCPQCGIDRNTATCTCEPPIDPRLAALKGLKISS